MATYIAPAPALGPNWFGYVTYAHWWQANHCTWIIPGTLSFGDFV